MYSYDYEGCESEPASKMMANLESLIIDRSFRENPLSSDGKTYKVAKADNFSYTDPIDQSVSTKQVVFVCQK